MTSASQLVVDYPKHPITLYGPRRKPSKILVLLHGGGGSSAGIATALGVTEQIAREMDVLICCPNGQPGVDTATNTWDNGNMITAATGTDHDDVSFLKAYTDQLREEHPGVQIYLAGHSNGGMMTYRCWIEDESIADVYVSLAGPCPWRFQAFGNLKRSKPMWLIIGNGDRVIGTRGGNIDEEIWWQGDAFNTDADAEQPNRFVGEMKAFEWRCESAGVEYPNPSVTKLANGTTVRDYKAGDQRVTFLIGQPGVDHSIESISAAWGKPTVLKRILQG